MSRTRQSKRRGSRPSRRHAAGVALIEALVGILLFSIGILGLVGMQAAMSRAQSDAKYRADAAYLASEIVGKMWADRSNLGNYVTSPGTACTLARCTDWVTKVQGTLPSSAASVAVDGGTGIVTVTLNWTPPADSTRTYALSTSIR